MLKPKSHVILFFLFFWFTCQINALFSDIIESCNSFLKMIPYKTCAAGIALLYGIREFPHFHAPVFNDGICYSQYGTNTDFYVLHLHGWGIHAHAETFTKQERKDVYIVSPRFSETTDRKIFSSCFGQDLDAVFILQAIHETHHNTNAINTVAHCRGATAFFTTISILSNPDHTILKQVGITEDERLVILEKFKKGNAIIISPLFGAHLFLYYWFTRPFGAIIHEYILPWLTRYKYNPHGKSVLKNLSQWSTNIPLCIILSEYDNFIGTDLRKEFIELLYKKNGQDGTRVHILQGETKHWPQFLRTIPYKELFLKFRFSKK